MERRRAPATFRRCLATLSAAFSLSLGLTAGMFLAGDPADAYSQIGSGVSGAGYAPATYPAGSYQQAGPTRRVAGRSNRSQSGSTPGGSSFLMGSRNSSGVASVNSQPNDYADRGYVEVPAAYPQATYSQAGAYAQAGFAQAPGAMATPGPAEVYAQAYTTAIESGYSAADAQGYARSIMEQYQGRMAAASGQQAAPVHTSMAHQQAEQRRVQHQHAMAAGQQNAELYRKLQQQRVMVQQQAMQAQIAEANQAAYAAQLALQQQRTRSEQAAVAAASVAAARHNHSMHRQTQGYVADPYAQTIDSAPDMLTSQVLPSRHEQSEGGYEDHGFDPAFGQAMPGLTEELVLEAPSVGDLDGSISAEDVRWDQEPELAGPALNSTTPQSAPQPPRRMPAGDSQPLRRTPRRLPAVEPQPLQNDTQALELELQGFIGDELSANEGRRSNQTSDVSPVTYNQQGDGGIARGVGGTSQAYGSQTMAAPMSRSVIEETEMPAAGSYRQQLQVPPPQMGQESSQFSVEAMDDFDTLPPPRRDYGNELSGGDPLFDDMNQAWEAAPGSVMETPIELGSPDGVRAQPISRRGTAGRSSLRDGRSNSGYPLARQDEDADAAAQDAPSPRRRPDGLGPEGLRDDEADSEKLPKPKNLDDQSDDETRDSIVKSCDELRTELLSNSIRTISLDLSTPVNSVIRSEDEKVESRDWKDTNGNVIATGKPISATQTSVNIMDESGLMRSLSLSSLSGADQKVAWDLMDMPFECDLIASHYMNHNFTPSTMTWYASNLCHKPLYFEDIQLERYGHTKGPIRQPVRSAARFLGQAFLLPYQMSLNPPTECQYPLGLFRPGNCAPYLRQPFPWERRSVGYQAAAMAGAFLLIP